MFCGLSIQVLIVLIFLLDGGDLSISIITETLLLNRSLVFTTTTLNWLVLVRVKLGDECIDCRLDQLVQ